jgi:hypothetical protein
MTARMRGFISIICSAGALAGTLAADDFNAAGCIDPDCARGGVHEVQSLNRDLALRRRICGHYQRSVQTPDGAASWSAAYSGLRAPVTAIYSDPLNAGTL